MEERAIEDPRIPSEPLAKREQDQGASQCCREIMVHERNLEDTTMDIGEEERRFTVTPQPIVRPEERPAARPAAPEPAPALPAPVREPEKVPG